MLTIKRRITWRALLTSNVRAIKVSQHARHRSASNLANRARHRKCEQRGSHCAQKVCIKTQQNARYIDQRANSQPVLAVKGEQCGRRCSGQVCEQSRRSLNTRNHRAWRFMAYNPDNARMHVNARYQSASKTRSPCDQRRGQCARHHTAYPGLPWLTLAYPGLPWLTLAYGSTAYPGLPWLLAHPGYMAYPGHMA